MADAEVVIRRSNRWDDLPPRTQELAHQLHHIGVGEKLHPSRKPAPLYIFMAVTIEESVEHKAELLTTLVAMVVGT